MIPRARIEITGRLRQAALYVETGELATALELVKEVGPMIAKELGSEE